MRQKNKELEQRTRRSFDDGFKEQAIKLANEIGVKEAALKLGMGHQVLGTWVRASNRKNSDATYAEILAMREENKKLKRELEKEKKVTAILRDATIFFCQDKEK